MSTMAEINNQNKQLKILLSNKRLMSIEMKRLTLDLQWSAKSITYQQFLNQKIILESYVVNKCIAKIKVIFNNENNHLFVNFNSLANIVMDFYAILFKLFPLDNETLKEYIEFISDNLLDIICKTKTYGSQLLKAVMLLDHSDPEVYITAAKFAFEENKNILVSRSYIKKGIKLHADYKNLYVEEFLMELEFINYTFGFKISTTLNKYNKLISGRFQKNIKFHFMLLDKIIQTIFQFKTNSNVLLSCVIRDMIKKFRLDEKLWHKLATINYNGIIFNFKTQETCYSTNYSLHIERSIEMYERGLKEKLQPEHKEILWEHYIEHLINIMNSFRMHNSQMRNIMIRKMLKIVEDEKSLPLWSLIMNHIENKTDYNLDMINMGNICPYEEINRAIRPSFLEWVSETQNIEYGRELFQKLKILDPQCKQLFLKMIDLENSHVPKNIKCLKKLYSRLCKNFGQNDINIWLDRFEFMFLNGSSKHSVYKTYKKSKGILQEKLHRVMKMEFKRVRSVMKLNYANSKSIAVNGGDGKNTI